MSNYSKLEDKVNNRKIQVESAIRDGSGNNIENTYAKQDGYYQTLGAGKADVADNLTPYSEESGVVQTQPFFNEGTGTGNGENIVDTGSYAIIHKKKGNTIVYNQLCTLIEGSWTISDTTIVFTNSNGIITGNGTNNSGVTKYSSLGGVSNQYLILGHKYLIRSAQNDFNFYINADGLWNSVDKKNDYIGTLTGMPESIYGASFIITIPDGAVLDNVKFIPEIIDLTRWFNGNENIPSGLLSHPENFLRYYSGSLSYNTGTTINSNGQIIKSIGRNIWDEEWESGVYDPNTGEKGPDPNHIRSKNYIEIVPGAKYYCYNGAGTMRVIYYDASKNFLGFRNESSEVMHNPPSAKYITLTMVGDYGTTYNNDITISLYYEGESGYDQYYPYEVLSQIDTGSEILRSLSLNTFDSKTHLGAITRNISYIDLGELNYNPAGATDTIIRVSSNSLSMMKPLGDSACDGGNKGLYIYYGPIGVSENQVNCISTKTYQNLVYIVLDIQTIGWDGDSSTLNDTVRAYLSGVILYYELDEPIIEQGTAFSGNLNINDFGSILVKTPEGTTFNGVPMGNEIFYPVDYKAFVDTLYNRVDGDAGQVALKEDLDYDKLSNDPIINQDLDSESFTPIANTYYKHTGVTSIDFVNGGIYYYTGNEFNLLGSTSFDNYYTKTESDNKFVTKTTTVNGHALSGNISVTKSDVGLGDVVNTGDSDTPVSGGTAKFTNGGAYTELNKKTDKTTTIAGLDLSQNRTSGELLTALGFNITEVNI
jgi:hypothetical protein